MVFTPIQGWEQIAQQNIFPGESGGDYNALFGFSNRPGGQFAHIQPTAMTIGQVIDFTDPNGAYGQSVKGQIGRVATPVGAYQVVGSTLRDAVNALGLDPSMPFNKETQDMIGQWIYANQGPGAWEGWGKDGGGAGPFSGAAASGPLGYMMGGQNFPLFDPGPTKGDRFRSGLVAAGEAFGSLGAGHAPTFEATDAWLRGEAARRATTQAAKGQFGTGVRASAQDAAANNATASWLAGQGPKGEALAQAVAAGAMTGEEALAAYSNPDFVMPGIDGGMTPEGQKDIDKLANDLRSSIGDDIKIIAATDAAFNGLKKAAFSGNPMDTRSIVSLFSKLVDPTTGVLGGEAAATLASVGYGQSFIDTINTEAAGNGLTVRTRQMMLDAAQRVAEARRVSFEQTVGGVVEYAKERGVDPRALGLPQYYGQPYTAPTIPPNPDEISINPGGGTTKFSPPGGDTQTAPTPKGTIPFPQGGIR